MSKIQRKTVQNFAGNLSFFSRFSTNFAIFLRKFDEILPEFHRNCQEMTKKVDTPKRLRKAEKINLFERLEKAKRLGKD